MKKLIFLRNGILGDNYFKVKDNLNLSSHFIDIEFNSIGYNEVLNRLNNSTEFNLYDYIVTTYPSILSAHDEKSDPIWWNKEKHKWEIYFIENGKLKNIQEYTDKELRQAHNIEKLYLTGGLDD